MTIAAAATTRSPSLCTGANAPSHTRFDKLARNFLAAVALASARLWTHAYESITQLMTRKSNVIAVEQAVQREFMSSADVSL